MHHQHKRASQQSNTTANVRSGLMMTELLVAATLLVAIMSVVFPLAVRSGRLWQDSRHYRIAIEELSNQLDYLIALEEPERNAALENLAPAPQIMAVLPDPTLTADVLTDQDGTRLLLRLDWKRIGKSKPVELVGWIDPIAAIGRPVAGGSP